MGARSTLKTRMKALDARERHLAWMKKYSAERKALEPGYVNALKRKSYYKNRDKRLAWHKQHHQKQRLEILALFGGCCVRCGFNDWRALQLDHIEGGGVAERRHSGLRTISFNFALENKERLQLLCANCNWIKRHENREHRKRGNVPEINPRREWSLKSDGWKKHTEN